MTEPVPDVVLREYGPAVSVPLGAAAGRALAASGDTPERHAGPGP
ncbi:hypothetical protein SALBM217S_08814 [Streptomyces griseoloalbus]